MICPHCGMGKSPPLSRLEGQFVKLLCRGYSQPEMAKELGVTVVAVKHAANRVYAKFGIKDERIRPAVALVSLLLLPLDIPLLPPVPPYAVAQVASLDLPLDSPLRPAVTP